jgi:hypothetical protein
MYTREGGVQPMDTMFAEEGKGKELGRGKNTSFLDF